MKKTIIMLLLTALCMTFFTSCDIGNGLIAELFGQDQPDIQETPLPGYLETTPYYEIPKLVGMGYFTIALQKADGTENILMSAWDDSVWDGRVTVDYDAGAKLIIRGYALYDRSASVSYRYMIEGSGRMTGDAMVCSLDEIELKQIGNMDAEYYQGFYYTIPLEDFAVGYNTLDLIGDATEVMIDGWVMFESLEVYLREPDVETDSHYEIPQLVKMGYLSIALQTADGAEIELMSADQLKEWSGNITVDNSAGGMLIIRGYALYNDSPAVSYRYLVEETARMGGWAEYGDLKISELEIIGDVGAGFYVGFRFYIPLEDFLTGHNTVTLIGDATEVMIDGWVMYESIEVLLTKDSYPEIDPVPDVEIEPAETTQGTDEETTEEMIYD